MLPGGTTVSLFSSSRFRPPLARMPMLLARANPMFVGLTMTRTCGHRAIAAGAAVGRSVVDDDSFVRRAGRRRVERLEAPLEIGARVEAHDDDG